MMKRIFLSIIFVTLTTFTFAEKITFRTGEVAGNSLTDRFFPMDFSMIGSSCTVSAVKKATKSKCDGWAKTA